MIREKLKAEFFHLHFNNGIPSSEIELINLSILLLDVELIVTSVFENKGKLAYLRQLEEAGKIKLHLLKTSDFGEIGPDDLISVLVHNKSKALISLSHANCFTGILLPVKDISAIAKQYNAWFHLDSTLMIGNYELDVSRLQVDFLSFDVSLINGPVGVGCLFVNENLVLSNDRFNQLRSTFKFSENKNSVLITGVKVAVQEALENLSEKGTRISELRDYFIAELEQRLRLKAIDNYMKKKGLWNQLSFFAPKEKFGKYLIEKLDLNGFIVSKNVYPLELDDFQNNHFINISLSTETTKEEIDSFRSFMQDIVK
ncbi:MAG: aminotransferase class V-fold PLP-dependent enzyme [Chloroflexia bacterium]|nr:aminotransferase class V-fold PLP-dependent enzyme [Chloroflexia bacterium]